MEGSALPIVDFTHLLALHSESLFTNHLLFKQLPPRFWAA